VCFTSIHLLYEAFGCVEVGQDKIFKSSKPPLDDESD
jgi:hypothetical protein